MMTRAKSKIQMSEAAKELRRAYERDYYARNRERIQQQRAERWERKARELAAAESR